VDLVIQGIFFVVAALILVAAVMVVSVRNIIHAALWLISSFFGMGMLYLLLEAEFLAVVQVLIYVGAVSVLVLFAIMLTRQIANPSTQQLYERWWIALIVAVLLFAAILVPTLFNYEWSTLATAPGAAEPATAEQISGPREIGEAFMREYLIPFQVASVLLLAALVGAIVIAFEEVERRRKVPTLAERWAQRQQEEQAASSEGESGSQEHETGAAQP
jgi:NADH-quinone oxidoreductase subunit J